MTMTGATPALEHQIGPTGSFELRIPSAEVRLRAVDGDTVRVFTAEGGPLPGHFDVERGPDRLTIRQRSRFGATFEIGKRTPQLEIELPTAAQTTVDLAGGNLQAEGLTGQQAYRSVSGDVHLRAVAGRIDANLVSGELGIELAGPTHLEVKTVSGDVTVAGGRLDHLRITTTSGDLRLSSPLADGAGHAIETLSGDVTLAIRGNLNVQARTVSGDLRSDLPHRSEGRMGRRVLVIGDGGPELEFRSVSGDLRIREAGERAIAVAEPTPAGPPADAREAARHALEQGEQARDDARMAVLRALEQGAIDVAEATARMAEIEDGDDA